MTALKAKAIALCRVSTSKQRIEGSSLGAQERRIYECAGSLNADIIKLWSLDISSRKGKNVDRKDLNEMIEFCQHNKSIEYLIVDEADRFMRSIKEAYWWKVQFERVGVRLVYASMPDVSLDEDPMSVMREMMALFQGEASNHERITKTTDKMQARIHAGYYPGMVRQGYMKSNIKGLHVPREPQWSLLRSAMRKILYESYSLDEALRWLNANGYKLQGGGPIDMWKLKRILKEPYYAGIIGMSDWDVVCKKGQHQAMITEEEHRQLLDIASGKRKKFTVHRYNPLFKASNIIECADCIREGKSCAKLVGYRHHNNKPEPTRRFYERYRCRGCGKNVLKDTLHAGLDKVLDRTELIIDDDGYFMEALRRAWRTTAEETLNIIARQRQKLTQLNYEKDALVRSIANSPDLLDDIKDSIATIKKEVESTNKEIERLSDVEVDFEKFVEFAIDYTDNLRRNWWNTENADDRIRLKQLVYPDGLTISRDGKVLTPTLSPIYRYKTTKKTPGGVDSASIISYGGPGGT